MQGLQGIIPAQFRAIGQRPLMQFEIYVGADWVDLAALAGKHYVESIALSLGGATMTPNPVAGTLSATLANEGSIFHPDHGGAYAAYCVTGREVRISIGARYAGANYYWPRIIGYIEEPVFSAPDFKVNINGGDYMKMLQDAQFQELDATYPNHWGSSQTYDSYPDDGMMGGELYNTGDAPTDAMDIDDNPLNIGNWVTDATCIFAAVAVASPPAPSTNVGRMINPAPGCYARNANVCPGVQDRTYKFTFQYRGVGGVGETDMRVEIRQTAGLCKSMIYPTFDAWEEGTFYFTALDNTPIQIWIYGHPEMAIFQVDVFSIFQYVPEINRFYDISAEPNQRGPYHVTYDDLLGGGAVPVQQGEEDEGWWYEESTGRVFFDRNKSVVDGTGQGNVKVYYFTVTEPEDAVARILWFAQVHDPATPGVPYANEAAAKLAMDWDEPGFTIDKVWFEAGSPMLDAIKMLCERCNRRFYFKENGQPAFKGVPPGGVVFTFTNPGQIESIRTYQDQNEIKNRVIVKGIKRAEPVNRDDTVPSEWVGEANDGASIGTYGERTLTITNYLFQDQASVNAMAVILRDLYKTPNWYCDLVVPFNPIPLELGDEIQWEERLAHGLNVTQTGIIRDIKITDFTTTYKVVKT